MGARPSLHRRTLVAGALGALIWVWPAAEVAAQPPPAPVLIAPNGTITTTTPTYQWNTSAGATSYRLQVSNGVTPTLHGPWTTAQVCSGSSCAFMQPTNLTGGAYTWTVEARNGSGGTWAVERSFTVQPPPGPPLVYPTGSIIDPNPNYTWNTSPGATEYFVQVGDGIAILNQGNYTTAQVCSGSSCAVNFGRNLAVGSYWWGVQARNAAGGTWSTVSFSVQAPPPATLVSPGGTIFVTNPVYTWNASPGATGYYVQVADLTPTVVAQGSYTTSVCSGGTCAVLLPQGLSQGSYNWWVHSSNASGGNWSAAMAFSVQGPPAPVLIAPSGSTTNPVPTFAWNASSGATEYYVQVGDGSTIVSQGYYTPAQVCSGSPCALSFGQALTAGSYWWAVQARNAVGGNWSPGLAFTVQAPAAPLLTAPNGNITTPTPTYQWTASSGAAEYYLQVNDSTAPVISLLYPASQVCSGSSCALAPSQTLAVGSYTWWIQARSAAGTNWSAPMNFAVQGGPAPELIGPSGSVATATPTFQWSPSEGATSYRFQVSNGVTPTTYGPFTPGQVCSGPVCSHTPSTSLPSGPYTWTAQAQNAAGWGSWATERSFTVVAGTVAPTLMTPNGPMTAPSPTYTWTVSPGATEYVLQVDDASGAHRFTGTFTASLICGPSTCSATPTVTLSGGEHTWRVQAKNGPGGPWSTDLVFTVGGCGAAFSTGDFNGDGKTDRLCSGAGGTFVSLSTGTGFQTATPWLGQAIVKPFVGDFNRDGLTDVGRLDTGTAVVSIALSTGSAFGALTSWGTAGTAEATCAAASAEARIGDFNGDGRTDVACHRLSYDGVFVGLSTGSSFTFTKFGDALCDAGERVGVLDMNGDGKDDWYCLGTTNNLLLVFRSTGTGFVPQLQAVTASDSGFCDDADILFGDWNGDGKTDIACKGNGRVRLSTGNAYVNAAGTSAAWCTPHAEQVWPYGFGADVDGDGAAEMVCAGTGTAGAGIHVRKWLGTSLGAVEFWLAGFCFGDIRPGDFNGDGKPDILCDWNGAWASSGTAAVRVDLMKTAAGGLGGSHSIEYRPSTLFANEPGFGPRPVVMRVTTSDGLTSPAPFTNYGYEGGKVDFVERRSLGFRKARASLPCIAGEPTCPYTETTFAQIVPSAGKPLEVSRFAGDGFLISKQTYAYTETTTLPRTSLLNRSDSFTYDRSGGSRQTYSTFPVYDAYGNLRQSISWGEAGLSGDELQSDFTYVPNTSAYIVSKVAKVERRKLGQAPLQIAEYEYDRTGTHTQEAVWNTTATKGDLTAVSRWLDRASKFVNRRTTYSTKGDVQTVTDETNRPVTTTYHPAPHDFLPATVRNALNETTSFVWDYRCQAITSATDPNNEPTSQTYDELCRPSRTTDSVGGYVQRSYLNLGTPASQRTRTQTLAATGIEGEDWSEDCFDGLGRTYKSLKRGPAAGQDIVVEKTFNPRGGVATTTAPYSAGDGAQVTSYGYDEVDRLTRTTLPDNAETTSEYLANGQIATDPNGKSVITRVIGLTQEVERLWNGNPSITTTTYDVYGRQIGLEDAKGHTWTYQHDSLGRLWHEYDPDAGHWQYDYDDAGRPRTQIDAKGQVTTMTYDPVGRIATKVSPVGTVTYTYGQSRSGYSNVGRLTTIDSPADDLLLDYDALGRAAKQQRVFNGTTYTVTKEWDIGGYLQGTQYPDGDIVGKVGTTGTALGYDEAGRLKSIPAFVSNITYDAAGRPTERTNVNNTETTWTYNPERGFLENIYTEASNGSARQDLSYTYDAAGLVQSVTSPFSNEGWTYSYDSFYHLTEAESHSSATYDQTWNYDENDRITYNSRSGVGTYAYPPDGSATRPHAPLSVNGQTRTYDNNGNLLTGSGRTLTWDGENRLAQAVVSGTTTTFTYDSVGERLRRVSGSNTSIYPFGDDYEITNGTITKYIWVEGLGVVAKKVGSTTFWLHPDRLGSINVITNSGGTATTLRRRFRPYGETLTTTGSHTESRGWIDQRNDSTTGLTYLHARYFDPKLGQFLSPDRLNPGRPRVGTNRYAYGSGSPTNRTDRSGLEWGPCPHDPEQRCDNEEYEYDPSDWNQKCDPLMHLGCDPTGRPEDGDDCQRFGDCDDNHRPDDGSGLPDSGGGDETGGPTPPDDPPPPEAPVLPPGYPKALLHFAIRYQFQRAVDAAVLAVCTDGAQDVILRQVKMGAVRGAVIGAVTGGGTAGAGGLGIGAVPGAIFGAEFGTVAGAASGGIMGSAFAGVCSLSGAYGSGR